MSNSYTFILAKSYLKYFVNIFEYIRKEIKVHRIFSWRKWTEVYLLTFKEKNKSNIDLV